MFGFPWAYDLEQPEPEPKPKTVAKSVIAARGPDAESAMDALKRRIERETGKPHTWREDTDCWTLIEGEPVKERVVVKRYP